MKRLGNTEINALRKIIEACQERMGQVLTSTKRKRPNMRSMHVGFMAKDGSVEKYSVPPNIRIQVAAELDFYFSGMFR